MDAILLKINSLLSNNSIFNNNIFGIYLLEKLKFIILDDLKSLDGEIIESILKEYDKLGKNISKPFLENDLIISNLNFYKESISSIKNVCEHDTLSIVLFGYKNISIFESDKKSVSLSLTKNTGIVLSNKTISSEKIGTRSLIIDIVSKKDSLNIEK